MDEETLWESFKQTGRVADYLRYRGVDIYAATNAVERKGEQDAERTKAEGNASDRRADYT